MIITSTRTMGDNRVALTGDDAITRHFQNANSAAAWLPVNSTGLPTLTSISPTTAVAGAANTTVTLTGTLFDAGCEVLVNGVSLPRTFTNATTMSVVLPTLAQPAGIAALWQIAVRDGVYTTVSKPFTFT
jgi:hypothetical protein